jgi:hypothetical protein
MKIIVTPQDLIERCLWSEYDFFMLKNIPAAEKERLITENQPFEIPERDALIIGLLKTIYTDNLIHKVNQYMLSIIDNKAITQDGKEIIQLDHLLFNLRKFMKRFPNAYQPDALWAKLIEDARIYIETLKVRFSKLKVMDIQHGDSMYQFVNVKSVKKALDKHHE